MFHKFYSALFMVLLAASSWGKEPSFLLVTDIDDTIKITNMPNKLAALKNAIFGLKAFSGMSELYQEMAPEDNFYVLSGGPVLWRPRIKALLRKRNFPEAQRIDLRNILKEETFDFKVRILSELIEEKRIPLILVGDDTEVDPQIFMEVSKRYPGHVLAIYIRQNLRKELPEGVTPITTAFDMAFHEVLAERLTEEQALVVGNSILDEKKSTLILPKFAACPSSFPFREEASDIDRMGNLITMKLKTICEDRTRVK